MHALTLTHCTPTHTHLDSSAASPSPALRYQAAPPHATLSRHPSPMSKPATQSRAATDDEDGGHEREEDNADTEADAESPTATTSWTRCREQGRRRRPRARGSRAGDQHRRRRREPRNNAEAEQQAHAVAAAPRACVTSPRPVLFRASPRPSTSPMVSNKCYGTSQTAHQAKRPFFFTKIKAEIHPVYTLTSYM